MNTEDFQDGKVWGKLSFKNSEMQSSEYLFLSAYVCSCSCIVSLSTLRLSCLGLASSPPTFQLRDLQRGTGLLCASLFSLMNLSK